MSGLTHVDRDGRARMVDVSGKRSTRREAEASGFVQMSAALIERLTAAGLPKGDAFAAARFAGIAAAKRTDELIPLCHRLALSSVRIDFDVTPSGVSIRAVVRCDGKTGVEMEALTAVGVAALTLYDMGKALDKHMEIGPIRLERKTGGKSGAFRREDGR